MSDHADDLAAIEQAAAHLVPELTERLRRYGLGELEVERGDLRVRIVGGPAGPQAPSARAEVDHRPAASEPASVPQPARAGSASVTSPAVGFFVFVDGLGPGLEVEKGDGLGWVEMLGVRHDVRAPRTGVVRNLVAESGEAVEYGQVVIELETTAR